jgi:acetyltransferase-like isoleucine patch superfamily enzyme
VVVKPVPPRAIVGGNPARVIGRRGGEPPADASAPEAGSFSR